MPNWTTTEPLIQKELNTLNKLYWTFVAIRLAITITLLIIICPLIQDFLDYLEWYLRYLTIIGIGCLIWYPVNLITTSITNTRYKGRVLRTLISIVLPGARHTSTGQLTKQDIADSHLFIFNKHNTITTDDQFTGTLGTTSFNFCEVTIEDRDKHFDEDLIGHFTDYQGFFMSVGLAAPLDGLIVLSTSPHTIASISEANQLTPFQSENLDSKFHILTNNPSEATRLLTTSFATRLSEALALYQSVSEYTEFSISFTGQHMYIMSENHANFFEACETLEEAHKDFNILHLIHHLATLNE